MELPRRLTAAGDGETGGAVTSLPLLLALSGGLTAVVLALLLPNLWYGLHDISDVPVYWEYASRIAAGEWPYTPSFPIEYPPLAVPFFRLPGHLDDFAAYQRWFSLAMGVVTVLAAVLTALAAWRLWPRDGRAWLAAVLYPVGVALTGAIILNRYDAAVALLVAGFLLCLVRRWHTAAAFVLGAGFALKLTPVALLPLVLLLVGRPRRWPAPLAAFALAAAAPFLPYLLRSPAGVWNVFHYHLARPLQIESVLGTPLLAGHLLGLLPAHWGHSFGSHSLEAPGAGVAAALSGPLMLLAVAAALGLAWRRREHLLAAPSGQALAVLAVILALMTFGKVLSPQYLVWILPAWSLVAVEDRPVAALGGLTLLLTQVEFPALYWRFIDLEPGPVLIVICRNLLLVALFAVVLARLWRLPGGHGP